MKKIVLNIITLVTLSFGVAAQNVNIPDANFKAYLVGNSAINTNADSEIQISEANAFTGTIQPTANSVSDVTGLEAFVNITHLIIQFQPDLSSIDVSQNTNVTLMYVDHNNLSSLDVSTNTTLDILLCHENNLSSLDLSNNTNLTSLFCGDNNITELDVSQSPNLTQVACDNNNLSQLNLKNISTTAFLNASDNPNLTCIEVDDISAATTAWTNIDSQTSFSTSCTPIVNIPDANFKAYLVGSTNINTNMDSEIQVSEAAAYAGDIECTDNNISDLTGIEAFTSLTELFCNENNLTVLDVSQNTALTRLVCNDNNLSELDVSQNTALKILACDRNHLTNIDVSQNLALEELWVKENDLTSIDVNQNSALEWLRCEDNNLSSLDVSQNPALITVHCTANNLTELNAKNISPSATSLVAINNPNLTCIDVDDVDAANNYWVFIDPQTSFSTSCDIELVTSITVQGQSGASTISTLGGTLQMEASVLPINASNSSYTWSIENTTGSATINSTGLLTAMTDGNVTVTATANDASGVTGSAVITISNQSSSTGDQITNHNLSIYPNPANAQINIAAREQIEAITIMDIMGKKVKTIIEPNSTIDLSGLANGVYILQIQIDKSLVNQKIIKE